MVTHWYFLMDPLVFLDAAVVVGLEIGHLVLLIEGHLLQVDPRGVHMGSGDHRALGEGLSADDGQDQGLAPVILVDLVAGLQGHAGLVLHKALLLGQFDGVGNGLPLHAGAVQIVHVAPAVVLHCQALPGVDQVVAVFLLVEKLASQFIHAAVSPPILC